MTPLLERDYEADWSGAGACCTSTGEVLLDGWGPVQVEIKTWPGRRTEAFLQRVAPPHAP